MTVTLTGEIVLRVTFWICLLYPAISVYWPWWKSAIGVTVMTEAVAFALLLLPGQLHFVFGLDITAPGWEWFAVACFAVLPVTLVWRAAAIYLAQKRGAHG